jgi:Predicted acyl-CoA transferases/carnitine dehydratase
LDVSSFLRGSRVLDLGQYLPGPFATRMLADMGADVVKIEPPQGDPGRYFDPDGKPGTSPFYPLINAGKRIINLDLKSAEGRDAFLHLIDRADILLESLRPGVLERLGLAYPQLQARNGRLIHCALSGYGQSGPARLVADHDIGYVAMTGMLSASGTRERPTIPYPPMADHAGSAQAVISILGAMVARDRTGQGCYLDVSLMESLLYNQALPLTVPPKLGAGVLNGGAACYNVFATGDHRFVTLSCVEPKFWARFCKAMEHPEWIDRQHEPLPQIDLISDVAEVFARHSLAYWDERLRPADCCYQAALDYHEVPDHPHMQARGLVQRDGDAVQVLFPTLVDGLPPPSRQPFAEVAWDSVLDSWPPS